MSTMPRMLLGSSSSRLVALILVEHLLIVLSVTVAALMPARTPDSLIVAWSTVVWRASLVAAVFQVCLHYGDLYNLRTISDRRDLLRGLIRAVASASLVLAVLYYFRPGLIIGRGVFVVASILAVGLVAGWRVSFEWLSRHVGPVERLLIVGTNAAAVTLARELFDRRQELGVELVGFVDPDPARIGSHVINPGVIGAIGQIPQIVREHRVDRVVVSLSDARGKLSMDELLDMKLNQGVRFDHLASVYEDYTGKIAVENLRPSWMIFSEGFNKSRSLEVVKRTLDVVMAAGGLIVAAPVMGVVALAVRLSSPGPVVFHQRRVGKDGRIFTIHKFRTMRADAEAETGAVWARVDDPRVTQLGRLLRRTRLDELPQLWNVLAGEMSFVGPRPERPEFVESLTAQVRFYGQRHVVRPGLTGWAQVRHSYGASVDDALQKLQYELFYIKHMSVSFDLFILVETVKTVLVRSGS